jgi:hypothetical protein
MDSMQTKMGSDMIADSRVEADQSGSEHAAVNVCGPEHSRENAGSGCSASEPITEEVHVDVKHEELPAPGKNHRYRTHCTLTNLIILYCTNKFQES